MKDKDPYHRWLIIICLVFAGEMIFSLPFHIARFYRPAVLEVFKLSNTELGDAMAVYGIMAMLAYFPGGVLADRFSARNMMASSLLATGLGGVYLLSIPDQTGLSLLFGFWGITTILLFWAAMIRSTRDWGGKFSQGKAFGFLDGGRGLVAAGAASIGVVIFSEILPDVNEPVSPGDERSALRVVILFYTVLTLASAILIFLLVPNSRPAPKIKKTNPFTGMKQVVNNPLVWLQAIIVVCAYCGYKGLDYYTLYGTEVLHMNEVSAARFVSWSSYLRAVAAIGAGFLADRSSATRVISVIFIFLTLSYFFMGWSDPGILNLTVVIYGNLLITFIAVYALRGVYFALIHESKIEHHLTGTAVGLISVIGYTPDAFFNSLAGRILDASPGLKGFQNFYLMLTLIGVTGLAASIVLTFLTNKKSKEISREISK